LAKSADPIPADRKALYAALSGGVSPTGRCNAKKPQGVSHRSGTNHLGFYSWMSCHPPDGTSREQGSAGSRAECRRQGKRNVSLTKPFSVGANRRFMSGRRAAEKGWDRPRDRLSATAPASPERPSKNVAFHLSECMLRPRVGSPASSRWRVACFRQVAGFTCSPGSDHHTKMEWPMPMRRHPYLVPLVIEALKRFHRDLKLDPTWFILLWRLKPAHPPSRC